MKKKDLVIALGLTSSMGLVGCGGDSSSDTSSNIPAVQTTYSVKAIDGYLRNAIVWLDLNGDYLLDSDEPQAISGEGGIANLNVEGIDNPSQYNVVVQATTETVDEDTITENNPDGEKVASPYMMSAPAGTQTVTPLTTIVNLVLEKKKAEATFADPTTELTDEEIEVLKEAAIYEVAGDKLDPELIMGDYVANKKTDDNAARLAYEAKVLVESNVLPSTPEELDQAINAVKQAARNSSTDDATFDLLEKLDAVSEQTQLSIERVIKDAETNDAATNLDYNALEIPKFIELVADFTDDRDGDGVPNALDAFPDDGSEWKDSDGDGIGNNADPDNDNDGFTNDNDAFPLNAKEYIDTDTDGIGNNADPDDDGDGTPDELDAFPLDAAEFVDTDRDGTGNVADDDDDNDGILDDDDPFPLDSDESADYDRDGIGDIADDDDDNDGVSDAEDAFPFDSSETQDTDKDGLGDNQDLDDDNDGFADDVDAFPTDPSEYLDSDGDGTGNNADKDDDNDGVNDLRDYFPLDSSESMDTDGDGIGNNEDTDDDGDGTPDELDAFPLDATESVDTDRDGTGNNQDEDDDNDGILDDVDPFPFISDGLGDFDNDGIIDRDDPDDDNDNVADEIDAFPFDSDESADFDHDGIGDNADKDDDNDRVPDDVDALPNNPTEYLDSDGDGIGNNEDTDDDNDGTVDDEDAFPFNPNETADSDGDGIGDVADTDADGNGIKDAVEAAALEFIRDADSLYELHSNDYHDESGTAHEKLYVSAILVNDNIGVTQPAQEVNSDGSLTNITEENEDLILTSEGWVQVKSYSMDVTTDIPVAYPTNVPASTLAITLELVDLEGQAISKATVPFWSEFKSTSALVPVPAPAQFPPGSRAVKFTPVANQDIYSLWTGSEVYVSTAVEPYHALATTLEQVISTTAADVSNGATHPNLVYFGWNVGVELVEDGTANYYMESNLSSATTGSYVTKVAAGEWSRVTTESGVEILEFTVPYLAIIAFGEKWDQDSPAMFLSVFDDGDGSYVRMGQIERQGSSFDEVVYLYSEAAKTAILEQVVVKASDMDNDGVIDSEDAFPTDASETVDTDGDNIGNNADSDDDGDGVADDMDAFPLDATESLDSDGDGIGNNADPDDNNNGIPDVDETVPTASNAIQFIRDASSLYILDADDEYDDSTNIRHEYLYVEAILISENKGITQIPQLVSTDGTLTTVTADDDHDAILTSSGWTTSNSYTIDVTTDNAVAYPTNIPASVLNLSLELVDLEGLVISPSTVPFWSAYKSTDTQFPPGSQAVKFTPSAAQDIYSLWIDSEVHVSTSVDPYHEAATTLDQLISATDASSSSADSVNSNLVYFGWDMGVELVDGGKANYYLTGSSTSKVGTGAWTRSTIFGEDILQFTVPDPVITAYGEKWDEDSPTLFVSVYDDGKASYVRMGSIEQQGTSFDEDIYLFNETAKTAILEQVVITYTDGPTDGSDNGDNSGGSESGNDGSNDGSNSDDFGDKKTIADGVGITVDATNDGIVHFVDATSGLHEFEEDGEKGLDLLTVDTFTVNGDLATSLGFKVVLQDGTLGSVINDGDQMILAGSSWVTPTGYTLDISGATAIAYPTGYSELVYSLGTPTITTLDGETINATNLPFWSSYQTGIAQFPVDSNALQFTPVAAQDIYSLWTDSDVHMKVVDATSEPYHEVAVTLDDLTSSSAATDSDQVKLIYLGWDIGVELVDDGAVNFYKGEENSVQESGSSYQLFKVGETTWSNSEMGDKTVYQFTVTDEAIAAFGDRWYGDPVTVLLAENDGMVIRGTVELANQPNDYQVTFFNDTAYQAILNEVDISCEFTYAKGDSIDDFFEKVALYQVCYDSALPAISETSIAGLALNRFNSEGLYRRKFFFEDNTMLSKKKKFDEFGNKYTDKTRRDWSIKSQDGINYIETRVTDATDLNSIHVMLSKDGDKKTFAVYSPEGHAADGSYESSETDQVTYIDATYAGELMECIDDTNDLWWENSSDANYKTKVDYDELANACRADSGVTVTYKDINLNGSSWVIGYIDVQKNSAGTDTVKAYVAEDEVTMNADNSGYGTSLRYVNESFTFAWSINSDGQLVVTSDGETSQDVNTITGMEGDFYTQEVYWQHDGDGEGEIYTSTIMKK